MEPATWSGSLSVPRAGCVRRGPVSACFTEGWGELKCPDSESPTPLMQSGSGSLLNLPCTAPTERKVPPLPLQGPGNKHFYSIGEVMWGKHLTLTQCKGVFVILETCYLKPAQHRGCTDLQWQVSPQRYSANSHWSRACEETGLPCAQWERPPGCGLWRAEPGAPGRCSLGLPLGQASGFISW